MIINEMRNEWHCHCDNKEIGRLKIFSERIQQFSKALFITFILSIISTIIVTFFVYISSSQSRHYRKSYRLTNHLHVLHEHHCHRHEDDSLSSLLSVLIIIIAHTLRMFLVAVTRLYTLPCRSVGWSVRPSQFWIPSGFRITAPAQPSPTGLPCIRPCFF